LRAVKGSKIKPLDIQCTLFCSHDRKAPQDLGWQSLCPRLRIVTVGGTHDSILELPNAEILCRQLIEELDRNESSSAASDLGAASERQAALTRAWR
jgi:thioesterase domain-containing protein